MMKIRISYTDAEELSRLLSLIQRYYHVIKVRTPESRSGDYQKAYLDIDTKSR